MLEPEKRSILENFKKLDRISLQQDCTNYTTLAKNCLSPNYTFEILLRLYAKRNDTYHLNRLLNVAPNLDMDATGKKTGKTALHFAAEKGATEAYEWLIKHGATKKADNSGEFPNLSNNRLTPS